MQLNTYAIRDAEEYKNYCDRPRDQRPQDEEAIAVWNGTQTRVIIYFHIVWHCNMTPLLAVWCHRLYCFI